MSRDGVALQYAIILLHFYQDSCTVFVVKSMHILISYPVI